MNFTTMKKWMNTYFGLSKGEFNGMLVLIVLIVAVGFVSYIYNHLTPALTDDVTMRQAIRRLVINDGSPENNRPSRENRPANIAGLKKIIPFYFDPNTIGIKEWQQLGLSERQAGAILKYLSKGGQFRKPEDLRKMYTINDQVCDLILPYVRIAPSGAKAYSQKRIHRTGEQVKPTLKIIEINEADSLKLEEIRGIGPAFAKRIIKYRERLGGFYKKEQLMEVFGLDSLKFEEIRAQITVDDLKLKMINVNTAVFEDFKSHPYIRYKQINALIQYRKQHGNYSNIADLNKVAILDPGTIARLAPYFTF
ncbi:ComEA family DNA-binding protein [Pedobacter frigoris]|uniref:ComEA family DNA-binding protein n=1 Tax=Pedobacter frigoris TaxID=2571272 RepID=UPI002930B385|nr:helix-hairpin-helix domain-containing protein [Pedobacter frigoris]